MNKSIVECCYIFSPIVSDYDTWLLLKVILTDAKGGTATVFIADVAASNDVIHAIDTVIMPE